MEVHATAEKGSLGIGNIIAIASLIWDILVGMSDMKEDMKMEVLRAALLLVIIFLPLSVSLVANKKMLREQRDFNAKIIEAIKEAKAS